MILVDYVDTQLCDSSRLDLGVNIPYVLLSRSYHAWANRRHSAAYQLLTVFVRVGIAVEGKVEVTIRFTAEIEVRRLRLHIIEVTIRVTAEIEVKIKAGVRAGVRASV